MTAKPLRQKAILELLGHQPVASQEDLQRGAAELAEHFFAERPRDFGYRIVSWLEDWEKDAAPSLAEELIK